MPKAKTLPKIKPVKAWKPHGPIKAHPTDPRDEAWFYAERGHLTVAVWRKDIGTLIAEIPWGRLRKHMPPIRVVQPKRKEARKHG